MNPSQPGQYSKTLPQKNKKELEVQAVESLTSEIGTLLKI
jgi:hypothetical protein